MSDVAPSPAHDQETLPTLIDGKVPETRMTSAKLALAIYWRLWEEDKESAHNRARIQAMFDGEPPYNRNELIRAGQGFRMNLNFGEAETMLDDGMAQYVDLVHSPETLLHVETTLEAEPELTIQWNQILSREISTMFRNWPGFGFNSLLNAQYFLSQGVSIVYFEDEIDWRWKVAKFGDFKIPRRTDANTEALDLAFCRKEIPAHELYRFIKNEAEAKAAGWNVAAVQKALVEKFSNTHEIQVTDWERWQELAKECDLAMSAMTNQIIIVHIWVKELTGKVSHFIMLEDQDDKTTDFLFKKIDRFESMGKAFVPFTYGVGSTGNFHSIRGMGYKIFPHVQVSNRLHCQLADGSIIASSLLMQPNGQLSKDAMGMTFMGPYAVMSPDLNYVNQTPPNFAQNVIPALNEFDRLKRAKGGQYSSANVLPERGEMTRGEVNARINSASTLSSVNTLLFYQPLDALYRVAVERLKQKNYPLERPGGEMVRELRERIEAQGVPLEALFKIDIRTVSATRSIGAGSRAERELVFERLMEMSGSFDPVGRQRLHRDRAASLTGSYQNINRYLPEPEEGRVGLEAKLAELENAHMMDLHEIEVRPNDMHFDHLPKHLEMVSELIQSIDQGAQLEEVVQPLVLVHGHATTHMEFVQGDVYSESELAMFRKALQQAGETIINGTRRLQKLAREQGAGEVDPATGQPLSSEAEKDRELNDRLERQVQEHQLRLKHMQEKFQLEMSLKAQKAQLEAQLADAKTASEINRRF